MKPQRLLGGFLVVAGLFSLAGVYETQVTAANCTPGETVSNSECIPAHEEDLGTQLGGIGGCVTSYVWCVPSPGSNCGTIAGYGSAIPGQCADSDSSASPPPSCVPDAGTTTVQVRYYATDCRFHWGSCQCVYVIGGTSHPNQYPEVCTCSG